MVNPFFRAQPIWVDDEEYSAKNNQYVEFFTTFDGVRFSDSGINKTNGIITLKINADSEFAVWINGKFVFTGQHSQYPGKPSLETADISSFVSMGRNTLSVLAYHQGQTSSQYIKDTPRLIFEIVQKSENEINGSVICTSGEETLSRISPFYVGGELPLVSGQLGYTFSYKGYSKDEVDYRSKLFNDEDAKESGFAYSVICADIKSYKFSPREIKKLELKEGPKTKIIAQGLFDFGTEYREKNSNTHAAYMQDAALKSRYLNQISVDNSTKDLDIIENYVVNFNNKKISANVGTHLKTKELNLLGVTREGKGIYAVIDLTKETFGYLSFDIIVKRKTIIGVAYSDHLDDLRCRTFVGGRNFSATLTLEEGETSYTHFMQKIGARYIQIFAETDDIIVKSFGILPVCYPFEKDHLGQFQINDSLHMKIYDVSLDTLKLCMSEHYMDCPQREQSLYTMDSRNQMLCGYYAFGEFDYAKESLRLMAESLREDGLLELTSPGKACITIPSFSLHFVIALCEYVKYSGDVLFFKNQMSVVSGIMKAMYSRINETLALNRFTGKEYWNFHEWNGELSGGILREDEPEGDACLTALYIMAIDLFSDTTIENLKDDVNNYNRAVQMKQLSQRMKEMFNENFFDDKVKAYYSYNKSGVLHEASQYANALAILCGAATLDKGILQNTIMTLKDMNPLVKASACTLSTTIFKYEALLSVSPDNIDYVMEEIEDLWGYMLYKNATSFWETIEGGNDFDNAGSLCHGWSSIPIIVYYKYILGIKPELSGYKSVSVKPTVYKEHVASGSVYTPNGETKRLRSEIDRSGFDSSFI